MGDSKESVGIGGNRTRLARKRSTVKSRLFVDLNGLLALAMASAILVPSPSGATPEGQDGSRPAAVSASAGQQEIALARAAMDRAERAEDEDEQRAAYAEVEKHADRAIAQLPQNADARFLRFAARGRVVQMDGLAAIALQLRSLNAELDEVLRLDPDHADALASRGGMLMKLPWALGGDTSRGIALLERAVSLEPEGSTKRLELAEAYQLVGRDRDAVRLAREAEEVALSNSDTQKAEAAARFRSDLQAACKDCEAEAGDR